MNPQEAHAKQAEFQLLDVREPDEWRAGHVPGAVHIPMGQLPQRVAEVAADKPVLAICRSGARSSRVVGWLQEQGYEAHNLDGGLKAWKSDGLALEREDGSPGDVA